MIRRDSKVDNLANTLFLLSIIIIIIIINITYDNFLQLCIRLHQMIIINKNRY